MPIYINLFVHFYPVVFAQIEGVTEYSYLHLNIILLS